MVICRTLFSKNRASNAQVLLKLIKIFVFFLIVRKLPMTKLKNKLKLILMMKNKFGKNRGIVSLFPFFFIVFSFVISSCDNLLIQRIIDPRTAAFESNGGSSVESQTLFRDQPVKKPANPSRSGYTFAAWYSDNGTFLKEWDFAAIPDGDITLYAKWNSNTIEPPVVDTFTVTFDKNGGDTDPSPTSRTVNSGSLVTAPETEPSREGFDFDGWYREAECINIWDFAADAVTADITLYAGWTPLPGIDYFTVTFDKNGGDTDASPRSREVVSGLLVTAPEPPVREGFTFASWYKEAECINIWNFDTDAVIADITLYAKWEFDGDPVITSAAITVISPIANAAPSSTASGAGNFTVSAVTWTPAAAAFIAGAEYTASVTLTAKTLYRFAEGAGFTATINGYPANVTNNAGNTVTISLEFGPAPDITGIAVKTQPNLVYTHGQTLNLSALVVTLTYEGGSTEDVAFAGFAGKNISESPTHGTALVRMTYNDTKVTVSIGDYTAETDALTINKAIPAALTWPSASAITYPAALSASTLTGGSTTGTWAWQTPATIPTVTNSGYIVRFTPTDTNNYDWTGVTLTQNVAITVHPAPIASAVLMVGEPTKDNTPVTTASIMDGGGSRFTDTTVSWNPPDSTFQTGVAYTVTITLTANANYTFTGGLTTAPTISGYNATIVANNGSTATLSYKFAAIPDVELVTFSNLTANGSASTTTTTLTLTFSAAIVGLTADDITLSGVAGVTKGTLSGAGPTYTLPISGVTAGGTLTVAVAKTGYNISGSPRTRTIYFGYSIGDTGPGGGTIFYVSTAGFTVQGYDGTGGFASYTAHYLEAAPADIGTRAWATNSGTVDTATEIGTGRKNTALILAELDTNAPAAKACNDYSNGGKTDWFLPSSSELSQLSSQRTMISNLNLKEGQRYWSSSLYANNGNFNGNVRFLQLTSGTISINTGENRSTAYYVRAIRAF